MDTNISDHQYGLGELFGESWKYFRKNFVNILIVVLIIFIPINLILSLIPVEPAGSENYLSSMRMYRNISKLLQGFIGIIVTISITYIIDKSVSGEFSDWKESLSFSLTKWMPVIGTSILSGLIILGLTLCLIIPGIIWTYYYIFSVYVVVLRGMRGKDALDYSKGLVKGRWWHIFGICLALGLTALVLGLVLGLLLRFLPDHFLISTITDTITDLLGAYFTVFYIILFLNTEYQVYPPQPESAAIAPELGLVEPGVAGTGGYIS